MATPGRARRVGKLGVDELSAFMVVILSRHCRLVAAKGEGGEASAGGQDASVGLNVRHEALDLHLVRRAQVDTLSPIEALNLLYELKQKLD